MAEQLAIGVQTPLGKDALMLTSFHGREGLSKLFRFELELLSEARKPAAFDQLIGQKVTFWIFLPDGKTKRFFNGICSALSQTGRDSTFLFYRMEVVPQLWLHTRRVQSRIFQHESVQDILKKVFAGLDVKFELQGTFEKRDFCVQYRESDFAFASRLMEEEGIYYFFKFADGVHTMIVANTPQSHPDSPFAAKAIYEELQGGNRPEDRILSWEKSQELRSGKVTLWDHYFELPGQTLASDKTIQQSVAVGKVTHKLQLPANGPLELYDFPGAYSEWFDGVDRGGGDQAGEIQKIFTENKRVAAIRMEQEALPSILIRGSSTCRQFTAGHKFALERHFDADGTYVLTQVEHFAQSGADPRSGGNGVDRYDNRYACIPIALPFRPPCETPEPIVYGPQTAVVVGAPGEKIFCDKYARIKVQFHWDRQGKKDADSSCWIRVSQNWGGADWGGMFIPHVGQEVIVEFENGDPDRPLITGRVYNAAAMPPLKLPDHKTQSIIRDHGANEIKLQGDAGKQQIKMFSPTGNTTFAMGAPGTPGDGFEFLTDLFLKITIGKDRKELIKGLEDIKVVGKRTIEIGGEVTEWFKAHFIHKTDGNTTKVIRGHKFETIQGTETKTVVGVETKTNLINKNDIIMALNNKLTKGGLIDINNAKEIRKCPTIKEALNYKAYKTSKSEKEAKDMNTKVTGVMKDTISTLEAKIGTLKEKIDSMEVRVGKVAMYVDGKLKEEAGEIMLDSKGLMKLMASVVKMKSFNAT